MLKKLLGLSELQSVQVDEILVADSIVDDGLLSIVLELEVRHAKNDPHSRL